MVCQVIKDSRKCTHHVCFLGHEDIRWVLLKKPRDFDVEGFQKSRTAAVLYFYMIVQEQVTGQVTMNDIEDILMTSLV